MHYVYHTSQINRLSSFGQIDKTQPLEQLKEEHCTR